jgi:hypothetical protein
MPPSKGVPSGPWIRASQRNMSSSLTGPAVMPSGGSDARALYSLKRRLEAGLAIVCGCGCRWDVEGGGERLWVVGVVGVVGLTRLLGDTWIDLSARVIGIVRR